MKNNNVENGKGWNKFLKKNDNTNNNNSLVTKLKFQEFKMGNSKLRGKKVGIMGKRRERRRRNLSQFSGN